MPYVLSPMIVEHSPGMWFEGHAYEKKSIYSIESGKIPPVNYDEHIIRSHSLTHLETPAHTQKDGKKLEYYYDQKLEYFYGETLVIKLDGNHYKEIGNGHFHWVIEEGQIKERLNALGINSLPSKILITTNNYPENKEGYHDPQYVLTLSLEAAVYLTSGENFNLYGTSWKSSDFCPGKPERPIHNQLFTKAVILENLKLNQVPEGLYFMTAFPIPFYGASESPVVPVLFSYEEIKK